MVKDRQFWIAVVLFCLVWTIFFFSVLLGDQCFFGHDIKTFYFPYRHFFAEQIEQGIIPLWSSLSSCGFPVHAAAETGVFYPLNWLFFLLFPPLYAFSFLLIFHYFMAGFFVLLLQRARSVTGLPALFSAMTFTFSGFMITHLVHTSIICAAAWLPLLFFFLEKWVRVKRARYCVGAGLVISLQLLVSHPQIAIMSAFLACLFVLVSGHKTTESPKITWKHRLLAVLIILAIGYGLALIQIIPTFEASEYSFRNNRLTDSFRFQGSLQPQHLITLLFPAFFGTVSPDQVSGYGFVSPLYWGQGGAFWEMCGYTGILSLMLALISLYAAKSAGNKTYFIIGVVCLVMALGKFGLLAYIFHYFPGASRLRFPSRFLLGWTLMVSVLAGSGLQSILNENLRKNAGSTLKQIAFTLLILLGLFSFIHALFTFKADTVQSAARSLVTEHYINQPGHHLPPERYYGKIDQALGGVLVSTYPLNPETAKQFGLMILGLITLTWLIRTIRWRTAALLLLFLVWFADLGWFSYSYNQRQSTHDLLQQPSTATLLLQDSGLFRFLSIDRKGVGETELMKPCFNVLFHIHSLFTPGPLMMYQFHQWLRVTGTGIFPFDMKEKLSIVRANLELVSLFNIKYILTETPFDVDERLELIRGGPVLVYRNKICLPRFMLVPGSHVVPAEHVDALAVYIRDRGLDIRELVVLKEPVTVAAQVSGVVPNGRLGEIRCIEYDHHRIKFEISADNDCFLRISDTFYPGWKAFSDGREVPVYCSEGLFRVLFIREGDHSISLVYEPFSVRIGLFLSLLCGSMLIGLCFVIRRRALL